MFQPPVKKACCDLCDIVPDDNIKMCSICKAAQYCSRECQVKDWRYHKLICHPLLSERLKKICRIEAKKFDCFIKLDLFGRQVHMVNDKLYWLNPFKRVNSVDNQYCCLCGKEISKFRKSQYSLDFSFLFEGNQVSCVRCDDCLIKRKHICGESFMEVNACREKLKKSFILTVLRRKPSLCKDILQTIITILNEIGLWTDSKVSCGHITHAYKTILK